MLRLVLPNLFGTAPQPSTAGPGPLCRTAVTLGLAWLSPTLAVASVLEGFENALPAKIGDVGLVAAAIAGPLPEGSAAAFLTTFGPANFGGAFGTDAVPLAPLQNFAGLEPGALKWSQDQAGYQGSAIRLRINNPNGGNLSMAYRFLTDEPVPNPYSMDFAFLVIDPDFSQPTYRNLTGVAVGQFILTPESDPTIDYFSRSTAWQTFELDWPETGDFTIVIGVADAANNQFNSGLLLDDIRFVPIPEPGHGALGIAWLAICGAVSLGSRKTSRRNR